MVGPGFEPRWLGPGYVLLMPLLSCLTKAECLRTWAGGVEKPGLCPSLGLYDFCKSWGRTAGLAVLCTLDRAPWGLGGRALGCGHCPTGLRIRSRCMELETGLRLPAGEARSLPGAEAGHGTVARVGEATAPDAWLAGNCPAHPGHALPSCPQESSWPITSRASRHVWPWAESWSTTGGLGRRAPSYL